MIMMCKSSIPKTKTNPSSAGIEFSILSVGKDKFVFSLIVVRGMLIFIECKGKFAKLSYLLLREKRG